MQDGLCQTKIPMTKSGIEPETHRGSKSIGGPCTIGNTVTVSTLNQHRPLFGKIRNKLI